MVGKSTLNYRSADEGPPAAPHSVLAWISLAWPLLIAGSCLSPFDFLALRHMPTFTVVTVLLLIGTMISVAALVEASRNHRMRMVPRVALALHLAFAVVLNFASTL